VKPRPEAPAAARPAWVKPVAIGASVLAAGLAGLALQQGLTAKGAYADASAMVGPNGILVPGADPAAHDALVERGDTASKNAVASGSAAVITATAVGLLLWLSR
jgi:hypothetical protein